MNSFQKVVGNEHLYVYKRIYNILICIHRFNLLFFVNDLLLKGFSPNNLIAFALFVCFCFPSAFFKASISSNRYCKGFGPRSSAPSFEHSCTQPWPHIHIPTAKPRLPTSAQERQLAKTNWSNTRQWIFAQFKHEQQSLSSQWRRQPSFHARSWSEHKHTFAAAKSKHSYPGRSCSGEHSTAHCPR